MKGLMIASILPRRREDLKKAVRSGELPEYLEIRLDLLGVDEILDLVKGIPSRKIAACRARRDGGMFDGREEERTAILEEALISGLFAYIDVEMESEAVGLIARHDRQKFIVSYHDLSGTPDDLPDIYRRLSSIEGASFYKLVPFARSLRDNLRVKGILTRANSENVPLISFCMGMHGTLSRVLSIAWGSRGVYASLFREEETAPGQLGYDDLLNVLDIGRINAKTRIFAVLGYPLRHSMSPAIHNALYRDQNLDFVCIPLELPSIDEVFECVDEFNMAGFAVTSPFKRSILKFADHQDEAVKAIGAANTVILKGSSVHAYNTDTEAFSSELKRLVNPGLERFAVLGDGGAASAVAYILRRENAADFRIFSRNEDRGREVSRRFGCIWQDIGALKEYDYSVLVNCTTVGMYPDMESSPIAEDSLKGKLVYDLIYNPEQTKLMRMAAPKGIATVNGASMLLKQAALQFELLTGRKPSEHLMAQTFRDKMLFLDKEKLE
ncbi:MAG: type I 3-dehydroquinate dehydratase [Acidobacteriota bacterium]